MSGHLIDELMTWIEYQIEAENTLGDQSLDIEKATGNTRVVSTGHYQRAVAYKKCLQKIRHLIRESHEGANESLMSIRNFWAKKITRGNSTLSP